MATKGKSKKAGKSAAKAVENKVLAEQMMRIEEKESKRAALTAARLQARRQARAKAGLQ